MLLVLSILLVALELIFFAYRYHVWSIMHVTYTIITLATCLHFVACIMNIIHLHIGVICRYCVRLSMMLIDFYTSIDNGSTRVTNTQK